MVRVRPAAPFLLRSAGFGTSRSCVPPARRTSPAAARCVRSSTSADPTGYRRGGGDPRRSPSGRASEHVEGPRAQTLRRKIRTAERRGISCRPVPERSRIGLLARANAVERTHDEQYRVLTPCNDDLLEHDLWMVAGGRRRRAHSCWRSSLSMASSRRCATRPWRRWPYSLSRYLATHALVVELSKRGVRWLLDTEPPGAQKNGVRHFQRMVGFRYVRLGSYLVTIRWLRRSSDW